MDRNADGMIYFGIAEVSQEHGFQNTDGAHALANSYSINGDTITFWGISNPNASTSEQSKDKVVQTASLFAMYRKIMVGNINGSAKKLDKLAALMVIE